MLIKFAPMRTDEELSLSVEGDVLTINGDPLDLRGMPNGATLPMGSVDSDWITDHIHRDMNGKLIVKVRLPFAYRAPYERRFPEPITVTADGPIALPDNTPEAENAD